MLKKFFYLIVCIPRQLAGIGIFLYQKTISPDHGLLKIFFPRGYCKYFPSCSEYARQAIAQRGLLKGGMKSVWRLIRCNPYSKGGVDLPN